MKVLCKECSKVLKVEEHGAEESSRADRGRSQEPESGSERRSRRARSGTEDKGVRRPRRRSRQPSAMLWFIGGGVLALIVLSVILS
jgi:hypothetical protein